jgi:hypothetical protein
MFIFHDVVDSFALFGLVHFRKIAHEETTQRQLEHIAAGRLQVSRRRVAHGLP